jgi:hypothetical protein
MSSKTTKLRACLCCTLLKTAQQFRREGCEVCSLSVSTILSFLKFRNARKELRFPRRTRSISGWESGWWIDPFRLRLKEAPTECSNAPLAPLTAPSLLSSLSRVGLCVKSILLWCCVPRSDTCYIVLGQVPTDRSDSLRVFLLPITRSLFYL